MPTKKRVLVTGGKGFIGSRLIKTLESLNFDVYMTSRKYDESPKVIRFSSEISDYNKELFSTFDCIVHAAGIAHDLGGKYKPEDYYDINSKFTLNLADLAYFSGVKRFIFISSVKAARHPGSKDCIDEEFDEEPISDYGKSKRIAEKELMKRYGSSPMDLVILRPSLIYGPGVKGNLNSLIRAIEKNLMPNLAIDSNIRSMVHIDDVVASIIFFINLKERIHDIFIITDNTKYTTNDIYRKLCVSLFKEPKRPNYLLINLLKILRNSHFFGPRINKLFSNECYSSAKIRSLGFETKKNLDQIYEKSY